MIIKNKTIFVLGAGASEPFEYPIGKALKKKLCHELSALNIARLLASEKDEIDDYVYTITTFQDNFHKSAENSIDLFLKYNPEFKELGKKLIAATLLPIENQDILLDSYNKRNWYILFWNLIEHSFEKIDKHNIHFITFNYDRSLEHFLITALYHSYSGKKSMEDCAKKINSIDIIHVYGYLAPLPWQSESCNRPYISQSITKRDLENAVQNLFIIGEERKSDAQLSKLNEIKSLISEAVYIYFLGFGYDEENLSILGDNFSNVNHVWGTCLGLGEVKRNNAIKLITNKGINDTLYLLDDVNAKTVALYNVDVADFLKEYIYLS